MTWAQDHIDRLAVSSAAEDYFAFEKAGLAALEGARVLDIGCFDGCNTVLKFAPYANVERVVGIDPERGAVEEARGRAPDGRFEFIVSSFEEFETDERFDVVYFSHVLQHVQDPAAACRKAFELVKPGGWVIVKTVDDALKLSHPDPENVMRRLFALYEERVLPRVPHTRFTDRYCGGKCYALLRSAGFDDVLVRLFAVDTAGKTIEDRLALFERCAYFRRAVPRGLEPAVASELGCLIQQWGHLFASDDYYFLSQSVVAMGRKPGGVSGAHVDVGAVEGRIVRSRRTEGGVAGASAGAGTAASTAADEAAFGRSFEDEAASLPCRIRHMTEDDLGEVMAIEIEAFPSPWTPVAYAMDLRHNPAARYHVALDEDDRVVGYLGWWLLGGGATIMHVASNKRARRTGVGTALVEHACAQAAREGARVMQLEVRASNERARAFYRKLRFEDAGVIPAYYSNPEEDAIVMARTLEALNV